MNYETERCPHCKIKLDTIPSRKTICPFCKESIYINADILTGTKILVTKSEAKQITLDNKKIRLVTSDTRISKESIITRTKALSKKAGVVISIGDTIWGLYNERIAQNTDNYQEMKSLYYQMALFLNIEGKDFSNVLSESKKWELMDFKRNGLIKRVTVSNDPGCESCAQLSKKIFLLDDAIKLMPLPNKNCTFSLDKGKPGFCRCYYTIDLSSYRT